MIIFIRTLVISHINANRKNLGTLQAFGLSNNYIIILYTSISFVLVLISFLSSFLFSELIGQFLINQYIDFYSINNDYLKELKFTNIGILQLVLFLIVIPTSILSIFLLLSAYHFGKEDSEIMKPKKNNFLNFIFFIKGSLIILAPLFYKFNDFLGDEFVNLTGS